MDGDFPYRRQPRERETTSSKFPTVSDVLIVDICAEGCHRSVSSSPPRTDLVTEEEFQTVPRTWPFLSASGLHVPLEFSVV